MAGASFAFESLKNKGNRAFADARKQGLAPVIRLKRFQEALAAYKNAVPEARSDDVKASIWKNISAAASALVLEHALSLMSSGSRLKSNNSVDSVVFNVNSKEEGFSAMSFYLREALPAYGRAVFFGATSKPAHWKDNIEDSFQGFVNHIVKFHRQGLQEQQRAESFLWRVFNILKTDPDCQSLRKTLGFFCFLSHMVSSLFHHAVTDLSFDVASLREERSCRNDYASIVQKDVDLLQRLNILNEPLSIGMQVLPHVNRKVLQKGEVNMYDLEELENMAEKLKQIQTDLSDALNLVNSLQALLVAQQQLKCSSRAAAAQTEGLWAALDSFKESAKLLQGNHVEIEAFIMTKCAEVYKKLIFPRVACTYYNHAVRLALSVIVSRPALSTAWWFQMAMAEVDRSQQQKQEQEEQEKMRDRAPFLAELKDQLDDMKKQSQGSAQSFLKWVYDKHPPKSGQLTEGSLDSDVMKKTLRVSLLHYHPDKNSSHGMLWQVMCEEISKVLTAKYEVFK